MADLIPSYTMPSRNRRVLLISRPAAIPQPSDFSVDEAALPKPSAGKFLVRNIYLSVDPAQRGWASSAANYRSAACLGEPMVGLAVGVVVDSRHEQYREGSYIYGWMGWQDYAVIGPDDVLTHFTEPRVSLSAYAGILGINGLTAYLALNLLGRPASGETVLVTTAAGSVGSVVGQLAKNAGCHVIGLTGSDEKVGLCKKRFGYHEAYNYRSSDIVEMIENSPLFDIFFDSTGGEMLDRALRHMADFGRVIQCGTVSMPTWVPPPIGLRNEREILTRRLRWGGFVIFDHISEFQSAARIIEEKVKLGELVFDEDIEDGMGGAPSAIQRVYNGENLGKKLLFIG